MDFPSGENTGSTVEPVRRDLPSARAVGAHHPDRGAEAGVVWQQWGGVEGDPSAVRRPPGDFLDPGVGGQLPGRAAAGGDDGDMLVASGVEEVVGDPVPVR
jgi:hypothetical protein